MYYGDLILILTGFFLIILFSIMAARVEQKMWRKCRRDESRLRLQQHSPDRGPGECLRKVCRQPNFKRPND